MYVWKCWRDSRARFIFFLIVILAVCVPFTIYAGRPGGPTDFREGGPLSGVGHLWSWCPQSFSRHSFLLLLCLRHWFWHPRALAKSIKNRPWGFCSLGLEAGGI